MELLVGEFAELAGYAIFSSLFITLTGGSIALLVVYLLEELPLTGLESILLLLLHLYLTLILSISAYRDIVSLYYKISRKEAKLKEIRQNTCTISIIIMITIAITATVIYLVLPDKSWRALNILGILYFIPLSLTASFVLAKIWGN